MRTRRTTKRWSRRRSHIRFVLFFLLFLLITLLRVDSFGCWYKSECVICCRRLIGWLKRNFFVKACCLFVWDSMRVVVFFCCQQLLFELNSDTSEIRLQQGQYHLLDWCSGGDVRTDGGRGDTVPQLGQVRHRDTHGQDHLLRLGLGGSLSLRNQAEAQPQRLRVHLRASGPRRARCPSNHRTRIRLEWVVSLSTSVFRCRPVYSARSSSTNCETHRKEGFALWLRWERVSVWRCALDLFVDVLQLVCINHLSLSLFPSPLSLSLTSSPTQARWRWDRSASSSSRTTMHPTRPTNTLENRASNEPRFVLAFSRQTSFPPRSPSSFIVGWSPVDFIRLQPGPRRVGHRNRTLLDEQERPHVRPYHLLSVHLLPRRRRSKFKDSMTTARSDPWMHTQLLSRALGYWCSEVRCLLKVRRAPQ